MWRPDGRGAAVRRSISCWFSFRSRSCARSLNRETRASWPVYSAAFAIIPLTGLLGRCDGAFDGSCWNWNRRPLERLARKCGRDDHCAGGVTRRRARGCQSFSYRIIDNILLVRGESMLAGGLKYERQKFSQTAADMGASLLLAAVGLVPDFFQPHCSGSRHRPWNVISTWHIHRIISSLRDESRVVVEDFIITAIRGAE